jgi:hypothetical protein
MAQFDLVGTRNYRRCRVLRGCIYTSRCRYMHMHMFRFCVLFFRKQFRLLKRTVRANTSRAHAHTKNENLKDMYGTYPRIFLTYRYDIRLFGCFVLGLLYLTVSSPPPPIPHISSHTVCHHA